MRVCVWRGRSRRRVLVLRVGGGHACVCVEGTGQVADVGPEGGGGACVCLCGGDGPGGRCWS